MTLAVGAFLVSRYRIIGLLAHGGMGAIYKAFDTNLNISVAIKENFFQTPEGSEQFKQEALILARLRHPGLPRVIHHFSFSGRQYLVMDFIEGEDLWEIVNKQQHPLDERQALNYMIQVCDAVNYLHRQSPPIIHRDIKPQNIKITPDNRAVLVDFGIAKIGDEEAKTHVGARGVTPGFSPPEQYSGGGTKPVSDVYSMGATLYAVLTGKKPPASVSLLVDKTKFEPPKMINVNLSDRVSEAIVQAMEPIAENRPQSVVIWQEELQATLVGLPRTTAASDDKETLIPGATDVAQAGRKGITAKFWLVDSSGKGYPIGPEPAVIGRHSRADIVVNVLSVSRQHALIRAEEDRCQVMDNGSANGTFLNNQRLGLEWRPLKPGDILMVGSARFSLTTERPPRVVTPKPATIAKEGARTELDPAVASLSPATADMPTPPNPAPMPPVSPIAPPVAVASPASPPAAVVPPKKRGKPVLAIVGVAALLLAGVAGVAAYVLVGSSTASPTATATVQAQNRVVMSSTQTAEATKVEQETETALTAEAESQAITDAGSTREAEQNATAIAQANATQAAGTIADRLPTATSTVTPPPPATSTGTATPTRTPIAATPTSTVAPTQTPTATPAASPVSTGPTVIPLQAVETVPQIGVREVIDVDMNPRNPREVYALVKGDGIYKSSNGGNGPWAKMDLDAGAVTALVLDPTNPVRLFAPTWNAVLRSDDGGNRWQAFGNGLSTANRVVDVVSVDPASPNVVYAGIGETLVVSTDGGESWVSEGYGHNLKGGRFTNIVVDPFNHDIVYAAGEFGSIYKSVDSGRDFMQLPFGTGRGVYSLMPHPTQRDVYLAGINSYDAGIIKTENGADFVSISDGLIYGGADSAYSAIAFAPGQPNIIYAGSGYEDDRNAKGIFKSIDGGENWERINNGLNVNSATGQPHYVKSMAVHPTNANIVLAATGGGLFRTADGGANWSLQ